ncbi:HK97 gp10 family phage protein [Ihubacter sp. rT4E-8]|uniref:HK97 gp10 family phage protein n=1 Tax=Ihubacter sp. rT4E-8 TaxID=3242369 RepID=UPI003CF334FF
MTVEFKDNSIAVKEALQKTSISFLNEVSGEIMAQTMRNTPVDTGQLKASWDYEVDEKSLRSVIGSPLENAIWNEFGTGEYALNGDGRKGGWFYEDEEGKGHFTHGKQPKRSMWTAFQSLKGKIIKYAEEVFSSGMR